MAASRAEMSSIAGLRMITPAMQMEAIDRMRPDAAAALSAEVPAGTSRKSAQEVSRRSLRWLDDCLQVGFHGLVEY